MSAILVTGASSGLGWSFADQLAAEGFDLVITARREERLRAHQADLKQRYGVEVNVVVADLAHNGVNVILDAITEHRWAIKGLINNAGFGVFGSFAELGWESQRDLIQVNITSLVELTYRVLPLLKQQPHSFICNVASTAAFQAGPGAALYYASKSFVLSFTEALELELSKTPIDVSCLCPGVTATEFFMTSSGKAKSRYDRVAMSADKVVALALKNRKKAIVVTGFLNKFLVGLGRLAPRSITRRVAFLFNKAK